MMNKIIFNLIYVLNKVIRITSPQETKFSLTVFPTPSNGIFKINLSQAGADIHFMMTWEKPSFTNKWTPKKPSSTYPDSLQGFTFCRLGMEGDWWGRRWWWRGRGGIGKLKI